tara:strand:- start:735 stop:983 length:249 start_codon:yes stop_codon:yes gene_type:complete
MLTISMGIIFQFMLNKIKQLNNIQNKLIKSVHEVHRDLVRVRADRPKINVRSRDQEILRGDLTLEYRGAIADTRATFMLDKK